MKEMDFNTFSMNYEKNVRIFLPTQRGLEKANWEGKDGYEIDLTCGSDYSGDSVTLSNYRSMKREINEKFPHTEAFIDLYGAFGGYGIGFIPKKASEEEKEFMEVVEDSLKDYGLLDDDDFLEVEHEILTQHFRDNINYELTKYVQKKYDVLVLDLPDPELTEEELYYYGLSKGLMFTETGAVPFINWSRLFDEWESEQAPRTLCEFVEIDEEDNDDS